MRHAAFFVYPFEFELLRHIGVVAKQFGRLMHTFL